MNSWSDALMCKQKMQKEGGVFGSKKTFSVLGDQAHSGFYRLAIVCFHLFPTRFIPDTQISLLPGLRLSLGLLSVVSV